ncbi:MAG: SMC family ATPase, partial [Cyanobacteria bacterium P01_C01_bin.73]
MVQILSVALKNFKTHRDRFFEFQPGTNAIRGENGAGKTSILEAIAWTLFNYQGNYTKEDLIRNGSGSAQATVAFISSRDGRTYEAQRCTQRGYTLYDPQLNQRLPYTRIKDEVMPWLRQQLGVPAGTDLAQLFANTIGVPQGTFTADFLLSADKRKPIFDVILKVEEYRQVYKQSNALKKVAEGKVESLQQRIAQYDETLADWDELKDQRQALATAIAADETRLKQWQAALDQLEQERSAIQSLAQALSARQNKHQQLTLQIEAKRQGQQRLEQALSDANRAVAQCKTDKAAHDVYQQATSALQALDKQYYQRQQLLKRQTEQERRLAQQQTELTRLAVQIDSFQQSERTLAALQPLVQQQGTLEAKQQTVLKQLQTLQQRSLERQSLQQQQQRLGQEIQHLQQTCDRIERLKSAVDAIGQQEQQRDRLQAQLSRIEAAKQFQAELTALVESGKTAGDRYREQAQTALEQLETLQTQLPLLATESIESVRAAIAAGVQLNQTNLLALTQILEDVSEQVSVAALKQQRHTLRLELETAYGYRAEYATLERQRRQQQERQAQQTELQQQIQTLSAQLQGEAELQAQQADLAKKIQTLDDPRGRSQLLQRSLTQRSAIEARHNQLQQVQAEIHQGIAALEQQLAPFADLDHQINQQRQQQQTHQSGYLQFLQNQKAAEIQPQLEAELQEAIAALTTLVSQQQQLQAEIEQQAEAFDPHQLQALEANYSKTKSQSDRLLGSLPQQRQRLAEFDQRLKALQTTADQRQQAQSELKEKERIKRFINFARRVYRDAGPRITERYVQSVSREADRLFRELLNRQNVALQWTRDYEILVQEGPHNRRFVNLSGGEQMCAALAVRLALLKVLADIDIAFFDEPTTTMDRPRRESLAEAIARIRSFKQLFVISHDDTFE